LPDSFAAVSDAPPGWLSAVPGIVTAGNPAGGLFSAAAGGLGAERFFQTLSGRCVKSTQSVLFSARRTPDSVRKWGCRLQEFVK